MQQCSSHTITQGISVDVTSAYLDVRLYSELSHAQHDAVCLQLSTSIAHDMQAALVKD